MKLVKFVFPVILLLTLSCSSDDDANDMISEPETTEEEVTEEPTGNPADPATTSIPTSSSNTDLDDEIAVALQSIEQINSIEEVINNGWDVVYQDPETGNDFRNRIGYLYLNPSFIDEAFQLSAPEGILLALNPAGKLRIMGVAFLVEGDADNPPEGFTGEEDVWEWMAEEKRWVLHVWLRGTNPRGIFSFYHPGVANSS